MLAASIKVRALVATIFLSAAGKSWSSTPPDTFTHLRCKPVKSEAHYHPQAKRRRESGVVLLEYSVNALGRIEQPVVVAATTSQILRDSALKLLNNVRCKPEEEWINSGGPQRRLRLNVIFRFIDAELVPPLDAAAETVTVSAPKVPR